MPESAFTIPDSLTFEQAIALTQGLLNQRVTQKITESEFAGAIAQLVQSENGARGFFVTYLTDEQPLADQPSQSVIDALASSPEIVSELLVKNLAMSTAMVIYHRRNQDEAMAASSDQTRSRSAHLLKSLALPQVQSKVAQLLDSITTGSGTYAQFLSRWGYDAEQKQAIARAFSELNLG